MYELNCDLNPNSCFVFWAQNLENGKVTRKEMCEGTVYVYGYWLTQQKWAIKPQVLHLSYSQSIWEIDTGKVLIIQKCFLEKT